MGRILRTTTTGETASMKDMVSIKLSRTPSLDSSPSAFLAVQVYFVGASVCRSCPIGYAASLMRRKSFNVGAEVALESMASETTGFDPLSAVR